MKPQEMLEQVITLLNLMPPMPYEHEDSLEFALHVRNVLKDANLCYCCVGVTGEKKIIIYTREEAEALVKVITDIPYLLKKALNPDKGDELYFLDDEMNIFTAHFNFLQRIVHFVDTLRKFIDKCIVGHVDISFLNKYLDIEDVIVEFSPTNNAMRPVVCPRLPNYHAEDWGLEKALCIRWLYPLVLDYKVPLAKIKCCKNCGKYFIAKRLSATFCSDKCRGAFHYAANGE